MKMNFWLSFGIKFNRGMRHCECLLILSAHSTKKRCNELKETKKESYGSGAKNMLAIYLTSDIKHVLENAGHDIEPKNFIVEIWPNCLPKRSMLF